MFYRLAKFFYKKDGDLAIRAVTLVSLSQLLIVINIIGVVFRLIHGLDNSSNFKEIVSNITIIVGTVIIGLNYWRYSKKYSKYAEIWESNESLAKTRSRGFLVVLGILLPLVFALILGTSGNTQGTL